jgi:hypothetical protein
VSRASACVRSARRACDKPAKLSRRDTHELVEAARKMAVIGKAAGQSDLGQRQLRRRQQLLCSYHSALNHIPVGRHADRLLERSAEVRRRQPDDSRQRVNIQPGAQMCINVFSDVRECFAHRIALFLVTQAMAGE